MRSILLVLCLALVRVGAARAQHGFWQPDDRVLITSFHNARSIASDGRLVFVATEHGLEIYDQTFRRWQLPSTIEDGYPVLEAPVRVAYDSRERGIWLVTQAQTLYTWNPAMQNWQQRFITELPEDVRARLQQRPGAGDAALNIMRNFAGRDAAGRNWPVTGLVPGERAGTYWASTFGGNFSFVDTRSLRSEPYAFGTPGRGVSALALDGHYLWLGGDGASARDGMTRVDVELQRWEQFESPMTDVPRGRVAAISVSPLGVHAAGRDGVSAWRSNRWQRVLDVDTRGLAHTPGKLWVGGRGPLGWLDEADQFHRVEFPLQPIYSLVARADTLWIGAESGLYRLSAGAAQAVFTGARVRDVALAGKLVIMITPRGVQTWDGVNVSLPLRGAALDRIGLAGTVAAQGDRVWIGGSEGVAEWNTATDTWRYLQVPDDIPEGPIYDVVEENGRIWLATPAGALRLQWN